MSLGESKDTDMRPVLVCVGPSGVGKGTLINSISKALPGVFGHTVSHTTRAPRGAEVDGVDYHFVTNLQMNADISANKFLEHAMVHGNQYGTSLRAVSDVQARGQVCVMDIDVQGANQIRASGAPAKYVFITPPSLEELERRLRGRKTDDEEKVKLRLRNAIDELAWADKSDLWDLILLNDIPEEATERLINKIREWGMLSQ